MRVTKFNSDGSVNDVREYNVPLPSCVTSFDENQSFLNISFADLEIACQRKNSFEKNNVIEKMRFLISYDYKNYLSSVGNNENAIEIIDRFIGMPINGNDLDVKDDILSSLLCYYNKRYDSLNLHEITRLIDSLVRSDDLTEVLLYHISKDCSDSIFDPEGFYYRSIVNVISRLYYVLKRYFGFDSNAQIVSNLLHTIHPFATLTFSKKKHVFLFS